MAAVSREGEPRLFCIFGEEVMSFIKNTNVKNNPASYVWGVKNPQKVANKYNGFGVKKNR